MGELIEVIFANPFLLILILGGLISAFSGNRKPNEEDSGEKVPRQPNQSREQMTRSSRSQQQPNRANPQPVSQHRNIEQEINHHGRTKQTRSRMTTAEKLREEQLKQFEKQMNIQIDHEDQQPSRKKLEIERKRPQRKRKQQKQAKNIFRSNLTREGLINSVIMAEVLNEPRAKRKYENVIMKRMRR